MSVKKSTIIIALLAVIVIILASVAIWAIWFRNTNTVTVLTPDYAPHEEEKNAEAMEVNDEKKLTQPAGGGGVGLEYTKDVTIDLSDKTASLYFANPSRSNQDMLIQIMIQDTVIVQSGTLKPGNKVTTLDLIDGAEKKLKEGTYDGKYVILFYQQDTGEKAILNTEIPISIKVNK